MKKIICIILSVVLLAVISVFAVYGYRELPVGKIL